MHEARQPHQKIEFTIDGRQYSTSDVNQPAADLLRLAGVDPALFDLARIKRGGEHKVFKDQQAVKLDDGDEFVTVRQNAQVA